MDFIFHLGFHEELAKLELQKVLGETPVKISPRRYKVSLDNFSELNSIAHRLGGLVEVRTESEDKLVWRHQAKEWYKRDRLKPFADFKKGMLPPKIARIMVNICLGNDYKTSHTLLDPFCGSGNILMEAGLLKVQLIGTDINQEQLDGTKKNLNWLGIDHFKLLKIDSTQLSKHLTGKVNYIVSEPFMGKPHLRPDRIKYVSKGLHKLYLGSLKNWLHILAPKGRICMIFPIFHDGKQTYQLSKVIDDKSLVGYNIQTRGLIYSRPQSRLKKEIVILEKK
jgi:tRNA G10  N-methylase Trm11